MSRIGLDEEFALGVLDHNGDDSTSEPSVVDDEYDSDQLLEYNMEDPWSPKSLEDKWKDVVQRLINNEVCWDVDKDRDVKILDPKEKESLTDVDNRNKTCPTVLHRLAHKFEDGGFSELLPETRTQVVGYLLNARKESKNIADSLHDPILTRAFEYENIAFIDLIINNFENHIPDLVDDQDSGGANCLHYIFKKHLPECIERRWPPPYTRAKSPTTPKWDHTLSSIFHLINSAKPCSIVASDSEGNTPIHYALAYRVSRGTSKYLRIIVLKLIKAGDKSNDRSRQFNKAQQSPYLYLSHTRQEFLRDAQQRSHSAAITSQRTGSQNISSNPGSKFGPGQTRSTRDEMGSRNVKGQYLDNSKDVPMKEARFKFPPSQHNKDNMKRDVRTVKQQLRPDSPKSFSLTRQNTSGPRDNLTDALRPEPPTASPDVEVGDLTPTCRQENTTSLNSGQNVVSGKTPLTAESPLHGQQNGRESTGGSAKEATQELKDLKKRKTDREKEERCLEAAENMHQQLKLHYIRSRSDVEAKELLYGRIASDKNLYFDATNLKGKTSKEVADLVTMLANPGGFEDILSYVSLPVLSYTKDLMSSSSQSSRNYDANERRQRSMSGYGDKTTGRNSAVAVLDKLAEFGVRKVIRLIVEEDLKSPHTDAAIERAICGKDSMQPEHGRKYPGIAVEVWDWKKCDLSTDVIRFASPKVSEVNLYWTGNQIVLKGWASKEGIPRLFVDSEKRLKTVNIFWSPGFETVQRCESLLVDFQKQVKTQTSDASDKRVPSGVTVNTRRLSMGVVSEGEDSGHQGPFTLGDPRAPPEHGWIESMEMFRKALMALHSTLPKELKVRRVKVALIDDGVDRANLNTYQDRVEVTGMSYWTSSMGMSLQNPSWHQSTHGHGTIMANSIIRINPWVSLYAMRIQDEVNTSSRGEVSIRIHAGSAARAIEDAVIRKVDIISISWTIQNITAQGARATHGEEGKAIEALKSAINNARRQGILIFCSASDDVKKKGTDTLPYSAASDYIFRIGAADAYGWSDKATEDQRAIDYFLPGSQVVDDFNPRMVRKEELKYRDGSSVATALAAGLASIVLYMTSLLEVHYDTNVENKTRFSKYGESLRRRDGLKKAFENIITNDFRDKKFLPVWESFRSRADLILNNPKDLRKNWEILEVLCTKLAV